MQQFDQWHDYWDNFLLHKHGKTEVTSEDDLFFQVARTVNKRPVEKEVLDIIIAQIITDLQLTKDDVLVDFCCGNGLFTYELRDTVKEIIAVDFAQNIIDTANKYKPAANIAYRLGSAITYMDGFGKEWPGIVPEKYLMNDSLAYFTPADLEAMLKGISGVSPVFSFLLRGAPNEDMKWNFYNTEERKQYYYDNLAKGDLTNGGLGAWWKPEDIQDVCTRLGLNCVITNQVLPVSDYRMDILISTKG
jgi:hypothetical protein